MKKVVHVLFLTDASDPWGNVVTPSKSITVHFVRTWEMVEEAIKASPSPDLVIIDPIGRTHTDLMTKVPELFRGEPCFPIKVMAFETRGEALEAHLRNMGAEIIERTSDGITQAVEQLTQRKVVEHLG
jgi:hypothetical protein